MTTASPLPSASPTTASELAPLSLGNLLSNLPGAAYRCHADLHWTMEFVSEGIQTLTGYSPGAFTVRPRLSFASLIHPDDREGIEKAVESTVRSGARFQLKYRIRCADGTTRWVWEQGSTVAGDADGHAMLEGFITDITRMHEAEALVQEQASFLQRARDAIIAWDMDSRIAFWNQGAERLYGWTMEQVRGRRFCDLVCERLADYREAFEATLQHGEWYGELTHFRSDGSTIVAETSWTLLSHDPSRDTPPKILMISTDISERKRSEEQIQQLAFFDGLTGLPNRASFMNYLQHALVGSARSKLYGALLFCDLDNFKRINDTDGHASGDSLLQAVADRFRHAVRAADIVARLGGDEFVVLVAPTETTKIAAAAQAEAVAEKLIGTMARPVQCADKAYPVSVSVGVTTLCGTEDTVTSALQAADLAMYQAKACGRNTFRFHDPAVQAAWCARAELEQDLRRAIRDGEFLLYYQPQLDEDDHVIGAEALLRWRLPSGKLVYPEEFIKVAEESHFIVDLGRWILREACQQLASWQTMPATARLTLSVNVSARQFIAPEFVETLQQIFEETGVDPQRLKLELTESLLIHDFETTAQTMTILKSHGVSFSLDDFGTGYSSLAYLRKLPLDQLKIDLLFMREVLTNQGDASIVRSIIALARGLGLQVIAEGVETPGQRTFLSEAGCHLYQGFLFNQAISADRFVRYAGRAGS